MTAEFVKKYGEKTVEVGSLSHYLQGFSTIPGSAGFFQSTVSVDPKSNLVLGTGYLSQAHSQ